MFENVLDYEIQHHSTIKVSQNSVNTNSYNSVKKEETDGEEKKPIVKKEEDVVMQESNIHSTMVEKKSPFYFASKITSHFYSNKIISNTTDVVGCVFFGTKKKANPFDFDNIYVLHDVDLPSAQRIKDLDSLAENASSFNDLYGTAKATNIHEAFWTCQHLFSHVFVPSFRFFTNSNSCLFV